MSTPAMSRSMKIAAFAFGVCSLAVLVWVVYVGWELNRPPFPLKKLEALTPKMATNDVANLLGVPADCWIRTNSQGQEFIEWAYSRPTSMPIVYVYFTTDGRFDRYVYDY